MLEDLIKRIEKLPIKQLTKELEEAGFEFVKRTNG